MLRHSRLLLGSLLVSAALAGCVTPPGEDLPDPNAVDVPANWFELAIPFGDDHDHHDLTQHTNLSTPNFRVLGHDPLETEYHGVTSGGYLCGEAVDTGERRLSFVESFWSDVAFVVADVTDPANPQVLGELVLPRTNIYDMAATPDGKWVVLGTSLVDTTVDGPGAAYPDLGAPAFRNKCTGEETPVTMAANVLAQAGPEDEVPYGSGVVLVDVSDPTNPVVADYKPTPALGAHSVFATDLDGQLVVLASTTNLVHAASYFSFYTIQAGLLVPENTYRPVPDADAPVTNGHVDGWIAKHPGTGAPLAYLADWNGGIVILDVSNLRAPVEVGRWSDFTFQDDVSGRGSDSGNVHGTYPLPELWDGKHYTFVGQEVSTHPAATPSGIIFILDTTDPADPHPVGAWTLPMEIEWSGTLQFSTHYFRVVDRTLFVAMYHGGLWAIDVSDPANPLATGVFIPDAAVEKPAGALSKGYDWSPTILDFDPMPDGTLVVWDTPSGVYTVDFDDENPAPAHEPWPLAFGHEHE